MTFLIGRTDDALRGRSRAGSRSPLLPLILLAAMVLTGCGVKNDLIKPNGQSNPRDESNPSKPPNPLGR
jgi:hypothetical protein